MEEVALLFSGGKDSSLAAYVLGKLGFRPKLCTVTFGVLDNWRHARDTARLLGLPHEVVRMNGGVLRDACERILKDGFPNNGLNDLHLQALRRVAQENSVVGDGTRRDDRAPSPGLRDIRSLEDSMDVEYLAPLRGLGYMRINRLAEDAFVIEESAAEDFGKADYEAEVRATLKKDGRDVSELFPLHRQTRVIGLRR